MSQIRWGIIGPGSIANNFADALKESYSGTLKGIASLNDKRREEFGNKYNIENEYRFQNYDSLLNSNEIDAVYISTPHTLHALKAHAASYGSVAHLTSLLAGLLAQPPGESKLCENILEKSFKNG